VSDKTNWEAVSKCLSAIDFPTMRHMTPASEHPERYDAIRQMLCDLNRLAREDGCIAAAWALDVIPTLAHLVAEAGIEKTWGEFYAEQEKAGGT
jgi:hypothetical protein